MVAKHLINRQTHLEVFPIIIVMRFENRTDLKKKLLGKIFFLPILKILQRNDITYYVAKLHI